jgi:hypothetical protein
VVYNSHPLLARNHIVGNHAGTIGGIGIGYNSNPIIIGNTVTENIADSLSGGIGIAFTSAPIILGNTVTGNFAGYRNGGIGLVVDAHPIINNTIVWGNNAPNGKEIGVGSVWAGDSIPSTLTISYSDVEGGMASVLVDSGCTVNWGDGMIDDDPLFVLSDKRDYRLLWESPCIDTGHPDSTDTDGTRSDMGAHYYNQNDYLTLYLTLDQLWTFAGEDLGVTWTAINRWDQEAPFWCLSQVILPGGSAVNVLGPEKFVLSSHTTAQVHMTHPVPSVAPAGCYGYWSRIGVLPPELYDEDKFTFWVIE